MVRTLAFLVAFGLASPAMAQFDPYALQRQSQWNQMQADQQRAQEREEQRQQFFEDQQRQREQNCYASGGSNCN